MVKVEASLYQYKMIATLESTYHFRVPVFFQRNVKTKIMNKFKFNTFCFVPRILLVDDRKENVRWNNIYATELEVNLHRESAYWSKCLSTNLAVDLLYIFPFKIYWKRRIFPPFPLKQCDPPRAKVLEPTPPPPPCAINNASRRFFFSLTQRNQATVRCSSSSFIVNTVCLWW